MGLQPKTRGKGYVPLQFVLDEEQTSINKCIVRIHNGTLFIDNREVNSCTINADGNVFLTGQHYTSQEKANEIRTLRQFIPSEEDDYIYFLEDGFYTPNAEEIRHISGAASADRKFIVRFTIPAARIWAKIEKQHPLKFAVEHGLTSEEITEISIERVS